MAKGLSYYLRQAWKKPDIKLLRERMIEWRKSNSVVKVDKPLRLDRAHSLRYKAKKGFVIARVRVVRGGRKRQKPNKGRKLKRQTNKNRVFRGLTSAGKKSRGLGDKSPMNKNRPSVRAGKRREK